MILATAAEAPAETFTELMDHVAQGFEGLGAAILVVGVVWSFVLAAATARRSGWTAKTYLVLRQAFGGTLLLGLEVLVAADLLRTVAVAPSLENVYVLGLIVVIRTFLSFSLETEIEGVAPWRRALLGGAGTIRRAAASALESETPLTPDWQTEATDVPRGCGDRLRGHWPADTTSCRRTSPTSLPSEVVTGNSPGHGRS